MRTETDFGHVWNSMCKNWGRQNTLDAQVTNGKWEYINLQKWSLGKNDSKMEPLEIWHKMACLRIGSPTWTKKRPWCTLHHSRWRPKVPGTGMLQKPRQRWLGSNQVNLHVEFWKVWLRSPAKLSGAGGLCESWNLWSQKRRQWNGKHLKVFNLFSSS